MGIGTVVSGTIQIAGGIALTGGTSGLATVVGAYSIGNGVFDLVAGGAQIINAGRNEADEDKEYFLEKNLIQTGFEKSGEAIGGETGRNVGTLAYTGINIFATAYGAKVDFKSIHDAPSFSSIQSQYPGGLNSIYNSSLSTLKKGNRYTI